MQHPLITGGSIVFIGSFLTSIGNYIYNLLMGRMLSVEDYGLLTSLTSLFVLLGLFSNSFLNVFVKFSAGYHAVDNKKGLEKLFTYGYRFIAFFGGILLLILLVLIPLIQYFLHISNAFYVILIIFAVIISLLLTLPLGILQGRMQFIKLSFANLSQPIIKISIALLLLSLGFGVVSPLVAILFSVFIPFVLLYGYFSKSLTKNKSDANFDQKKFKEQFIHYSYTYFLTGAGIALLSNTDILLVRYFFSEAVSGQYAALSLMGKAIFYLTMPVNLAFFPLIASKRERKERLFGTVMLAVGFVAIVSLTLSIIYFTFPSLILSVFFPSPEYKVLEQYLGLFSLYIFAFSLASLLTSFFLSIGRTEIYEYSLIAACAQIALIFFFHANLYQVIWSMLAVSLLYFVILLVYYVIHERD